MTDTITHCLRCRRPCRHGTPDPTKRAILKTQGDGLCPNCVVTHFLLGIAPIRETIMGHPARGGIVPAVPGKGPAVLRLPHIQAQLGRILAFTQLSLGEVDWEVVIANWDLPWPKGKQPSLF